MGGGKADNNGRDPLSLKKGGLTQEGKVARRPVDRDLDVRDLMLAAWVWESKCWSCLYVYVYDQVSPMSAPGPGGQPICGLTMTWM